ncbi:hypothetical protein JYU34_008785 [Plutella xylostella]|uniref:Uncharacterized protein n=1 Tax=Plutella xylostella TaxID=51655 RepID=A0ABQ7QN25_PLUXY|nr:hypothetical protein JYU34_008785 [Plutella xylostella]
MKAVLAILAVALVGATAQIGLLKNTLRVKWGLPLIHSDFLYEIPRHELLIISEGWVRVARSSDALLPTLKMYCMKQDYTFCTMYDAVTGDVSGLQISIPVADYKNYPVDLGTIGFRKWTAPDNKEYWISEQYFVDPEPSKSGLNERRASRADATLEQSGVWVPDVRGRPMKIGDKEADMQGTNFDKQGCTVSMGQHYYYNMTSQSDCSQLYPWFGLYNEGALVGTGFKIFGTLPEVPAGKRVWFEDSNRLAIQLIVPDGPECLYDLTDSPGAFTLHIYYEDHPYTFFC